VVPNRPREHAGQVRLVDQWTGGAQVYNQHQYTGTLHVIPVVDPQNIRGYCPLAHHQRRVWSLHIEPGTCVCFTTSCFFPEPQFQSQGHWQPLQNLVMMTTASSRSPSSKGEREHNNKGQAYQVCDLGHLSNVEPPFKMLSCLTGSSGLH